MKTTTKSVARLALAIAVVLFLFTACSQMRKEKAATHEETVQEKIPLPTSTPAMSTQPDLTPGTYGTVSPSPSLTSSAAVEDRRDSTHHFIRTADIKCRVKNVPNATYAVEDVIRQLGGYVSYTNLTSTIDASNSVAVSADSSLLSTYYKTENSMIIRVPNSNLDSALKALAPLVDHMDFRTIKANDVALQLLANKLKQQRITKHEDRVNYAINANRKKLDQTTDAEDKLLDKQEQADNAKIENLSLNDQVKFSTINLALYQPQTIERTLVYNEKSIKPYEAGLTTQLVEAAQFGWGLFEALLVVFVRLWPLVIAATLIFVGYRKWKLRTA